MALLKSQTLMQLCMYLITLLLCLVRSWKKRGRKIIDLIMAYLEILEFMWAAVAFNSLCLFFFKTIYRVSQKKLTPLLFI
jgi:hypothetical protein